MGLLWSRVGNSGVDNTIISLESFNGSLMIGGVFSTLGPLGSPRYLAQWDGAIWSEVGDGVTNGVKTLYKFKNNLYVGGNFSHAGGIFVNHVARWTGAEWKTMGGGMNDELRTFAVLNNVLYAGGYFSNSDGNATLYIAKYDLTVTSIDQNSFRQENEINVFPNPVASKVIFSFLNQFNNSFSKVTLSIYNLNGKKVFVKEGVLHNIGIDLSSLPKGSYLYDLSTDHRSIKKDKLIIR